MVTMVTAVCLTQKIISIIISSVVIDLLLREIYLVKLFFFSLSESNKYFLSF